MLVEVLGWSLFNDTFHLTNTKKEHIRSAIYGRIRAQLLLKPRGVTQGEYLRRTEDYLVIVNFKKNDQKVIIKFRVTNISGNSSYCVKLTNVRVVAGTRNYSFLEGGGANDGGPGPPSVAAN